MTTRALQEATLLVLTALSRGSQHGCGLVADVQEISGGRVKLRAGTLYTALHRLRADGLVSVEREEVVASRLRRYYRLTPDPAAAAGHRRPVEPAARPHPARGPDLRIGDADREAAAVALREHFAQGRLTLEELLARLDAALTATRQGEVAQATRDLPQLTEPGPRHGR